jgi:TolB protein
MIRSRLLYLGFSLISIALWNVPTVSGAEEIDISRVGQGTRLIPINLNGFSGEAGQTLRFDLEVAGCKFVGTEDAQFLVSGSNNGNLTGQLTDRVSKAVLLSKNYMDAPPPSLAHAFADDIIFALTGHKGIAQTKIAFRVESSGSSEIYVSDYDGQNAKRLTSDRSIVAAPSWGSGKRSLYYTSYFMGNPDIFVHDLSTGSRKPVARYLGLNTSVSVSPNGQQLAMILSKDGSPDVYVTDASGGNLRQLTHTREDESSPCWSPDGQTICFSSRLRGRADLYTIPAAGGNMTRLNVVGVGNATEPDWSPDGKTIIFTTTSGGFTICAVPARGGAVEVLTAGEDPSWAPNSRTVVFSRRTGGRKVLSLLDVPTKQVKTIAQISGSCSMPSWAK